jgi:hypothetical protein
MFHVASIKTGHDRVDSYRRWVLLGISWLGERKRRRVRFPTTRFPAQLLILPDYYTPYLRNVMEMVFL